MEFYKMYDYSIEIDGVCFVKSYADTRRLKNELLQELREEGEI